MIKAETRQKITLGCNFTPYPESWQNQLMQVAVSRKEEGLRERKRRETLQRISEVGLRLFMAKGYHATTLDEIAAEAGISRRTFFYYFKSKDDIILGYIDDFVEALKTEIINSATSHSPLSRVQNAMMKVFGRFETSRLLAIARVRRESGIKRQHSLELEQAILEALSDIWPAKNRRMRLRLVALASMGAMRVAVDAWLEQDGKRPLPNYFREAFNDLRAEIGTTD